MPERYENIVFMQGDEADEPLRILFGKTDDSVVWSGPDHVSEAIAYLAQWDNNGGGGAEIRDAPSAGESDSTARQGDYLLAWNLGLSYIGLERVVPA